MSAILSNPLEYKGDPEFTLECKPIDPPYNFKQCLDIMKSPMDITSKYLKSMPLLEEFIADTLYGASARQALKTMETQIVSTAIGELDASISTRAAGIKDGPKAADIYRMYAEALRAIYKRGERIGSKEFLHRDARDVLNSLYLEQTLPDRDLETPEYIEPYTGEVDPEWNEFQMAIPEKREQGVQALLDAIEEIPEVKPMIREGEVAQVKAGNSWALELKNAGDQCVLDLKWDPATVKQFVRANEDFVALDDEEPLDDDRGFVPSSLIDNFKLDQEGISSTYKASRSYHQWRNEIFKWMKEEKIQPGDWLKTFAKVAYDEYQTICPTRNTPYLDMVTEIHRVNKEFDMLTAAAVFLKIAGGYGVRDQDVADINITSQDHPWLGYSNMLSLIEGFEDDIFELMQDGYPKSGVSKADVYKFDAETIRMMEANLPDRHSNPTDTASWNIGYINAIAEGATFRQAEDTAFAHWRNVMSPEASKEYDIVYAETKDRKQAMKKFWSLVTDVPKPKDRVVALSADKKGLRLNSAKGRIVTWYVASLKLAGDELDIEKDQAASIYVVLSNHKIGLKFAADLKKKFEL